MKSSETGQGRTVPIRAMKEYRGSRSINPLVHTSALDKISDQLHALTALKLGIELRYSLSRRLVDPQR
jgi:hypothetical protein